MNIEYREPTSIDELTALFRMRHQVYSIGNHLPQMIDSNINLDTSAHFFFDAKRNLANQFLSLITQVFPSSPS